MPASSSERTAIARRAALTRSATEVGADISAPARAAFLKAPPGFTYDPGQSEAENERRRQAAIRLRMTELGRLSARARRKSQEAAAAADELAALADEAV